MSENYNQSNTKQDIDFNGTYENSYGEPSQLPMNYNYFPTDTDRFYEEDDSGSGSFLMGALVGGVIGAAAALFLAPKTGKEMRDDFSTQAVQIKNKSIELSSTAKDKAADFSSTAKDKAAEFSAAAKEKTGDLKKNVQEQTGNVTEKVKTMTSKSSAPLDDGTASSEGEEPIVSKDSKKSSQKESSNKAAEKKETSYQTTENSDVAYDNSENVGEDKYVNQNAVSDIQPKKN